MKKLFSVLCLFLILSLTASSAVALESDSDTTVFWGTEGGPYSGSLVGNVYTNHSTLSIKVEAIAQTFWGPSTAPPEGSSARSSLQLVLTDDTNFHYYGSSDSGFIEPLWSSVGTTFSTVQSKSRNWNNLLVNGAHQVDEFGIGELIRWGVTQVNIGFDINKSAVKRSDITELQKLYEDVQLDYEKRLRSYKKSNINNKLLANYNYYHLTDWSKFIEGNIASLEKAASAKIRFLLTDHLLDSKIKIGDIAPAIYVNKNGNDIIIVSIDETGELNFWQSMLTSEIKANSDFTHYNWTKPVQITDLGE